MPFVDTSSLPVIERLPGWKGRLGRASDSVLREGGASPLV